MKDLLWNLFVHTGKIEYYIKYKELLRSTNNEGCNSREDL